MNRDTVIVIFLSFLILLMTAYIFKFEILVDDKNNIDININSDFNDVKIPIDTLKLEKIKHIPSYTNPEKYHIIFYDGKYIATFPGGTYIETYETYEDARNEIIRLAKDSKKRWIESGGLNY